MKKMAFAVLFAVMAVFSTAVFAEDEDPCAMPANLTEIDGVYQIGTCGDLYKFAEMVNGGETGINGRLTADICVNACGEGESVLKADGTLNGNGSNFTQWTPMNVKSGVQVTLNGAGKTISGLYFNDENQDNVGLFGKVEGALSINNLGIVDSYFKGKRYVGGLVGRSFYGTLTIMNSYNVGTVCGDYVVGGLVGMHDRYGELTIANSYNAGAVSGRTEIGGLVGYFDYYSKLTITNSYNSGVVSGSKKIGGLVGVATDHSTLIITNSYNAGAVTGESGVGGFVGGIAFEEVLTIIENSYNVGTVSGTDDCVGGLVAGCSSNYGSLVIKNSYNLGAVSGHYFIGGLVATSAGCSLTIENSYNAGAVSGGGLNVGGLVGWNNSGAMSRAALIITNSYNAGTVRGFDYVGGLVGKSEQALTITNSYNAGAVSGSDSYVGGLVGESEEALTITNSFFLATDGIGGCNGKCPAYSGTGKSEEEFHNGDVVAELHNWCETEDGTETCKEDGLDGSVWGQDLNDANSLPDFSGVIGTQHLLRLHTFEGDTRVYPTKYAEEYEFKLPTDLVRDGYVFMGWSTKEHAESVTDMVSSIATGSTGDLEFYAQWMKMNSEHVFEIASEEDLYEFAKWTNMGFVINAKLVENICLNACSEGESVLKADGTLNDADTSKFVKWTPIGTKDNPYIGTFDGQGHTVSGLYFNDDQMYYVGFFGYVGSGDETKGVVKNVGVVNSYIKGYVEVGGVVGYNKGTVSNSYNASAVNGKNQYVGGVVGYNNKGTVSNSYNTGAVSGNSHVVGGVVGYNLSGTVSNSYNAGPVYCGGQYFGGVVGFNMKGKVEKAYYNEDVFKSDAIGGADETATATNVGGKTSAELAAGTDVVLDADFWVVGAVSENVKQDTLYYPYLKVFGPHKYVLGDVKKYAITVAVNDKTMGTVTGAGEYEYGTKVEISATAKKGYKFVKWSDGVKDAKRTITVTKAEKLTATFEKDSKKDAVVAMAQLPQFSVTASGKMVSIAGARPNSIVNVFDMQGNMVKTVVATAANFTFALPSAGVYIVKNGYTAKRVNVR